ncbi:MAG TPA: hypothetical protein VIG41_11055, partial [Micrococcaceae bacterium]
VLGGNVTESASAWLARTSGGNPMFVLALISNAQRTGRLVENHGVWVLKDDTLAPDIRLTDLLRHQISRLSNEEHELLETVAMAEPIPLNLLFELSSRTAVDTLADGNFIRIEGGPDRRVRLYHPLYGEILRSIIPAGRSLRCRERILAVMPAEGYTADSLLRHVGWSLDAGIPVDDERLLQAATLANNLFDSGFALRAAAAAKDPGRQAEAAVQQARAHYSNGNQREAREILDGLAEAVHDPRTIQTATLISVHLHLRADANAADLQGVVSTWRAAVARLDGATPDGAHTAKELRAAVRAVELLAMVPLLGQENGLPLERVMTSLAAAEADSDPDGVLACLVLISRLHLAAGRVESGLEASQQAYGAVMKEPFGITRYFEFVVMWHALALMMASQWDALADFLDQQRSAHPRGLIHFGGISDLLTGIARLHRGNYPEALHALAGAIEELRLGDVENMLPMALAHGALAAVLCSEPAVADGYIDESRNRSYEGSGQTRLVSQGTLAAARTLRGVDKRALDELLDLAELARSSRWVLVEAKLRLLA